MKRQIGKFYVSHRFFTGVPLDGVNLFHNMIILRASDDLNRDQIEYYGIHPDFRKVSDGEFVPEYEAIFSYGSVYPKWIEELR